jgi:hypothetical protein
VISKLGGVAWKTRDWEDEVLSWVIQDLINREIVEVDTKDGVSEFVRLGEEVRKVRLPQVRGSFIVYRSISHPRLTHLNPCPSKPHLILTQFSPRLTRLTPTAH